MQRLQKLQLRHAVLLLHLAATVFIRSSRKMFVMPMGRTCPSKAPSV
jgi:hypothetical protein